MLNGSRVARTSEIHCLEDKKVRAVLTPVLADLPQSEWHCEVTSATAAVPGRSGVYIHHQRIRTVRRIKVGAWGARPSVGGSRVPA